MTNRVFHALGGLPIVAAYWLYGWKAAGLALLTGVLWSLADSNYAPDGSSNRSESA